MSGTQTAKGKRHNKEQTERENRNKETNCTYVLVMYELNIKESIRNTIVCKGKIRDTIKYTSERANQESNLQGKVQ